MVQPALHLPALLLLLAGCTAKVSGQVIPKAATGWTFGRGTAFGEATVSCLHT